MPQAELALAGPRVLRNVRVILFFGLITAAQAVTAAEHVVQPVMERAPEASLAEGSHLAERCAALTVLSLQGAAGGPAIVLSAELVEVPASGLEHFVQSGYAGPGATRSLAIRHYCDVRGYVAPQNKFELKLPLAADWNHNFYFYACGGFCGEIIRDALNFGLKRGYASATGNGGHDSALGFDGVWAANAPELQEDFGWRSNHVVTLIAKAITSHYYGEPIRHSYMAGNSKGGQAVLMEAQRFPEDYDGLMPSAPVYDYTGRNTIAAAWFAQAFTDGHGGSLLSDGVTAIVHKSVLKLCGAQSGVDEGLVTDPTSCAWRPELIACPAQGREAECLNPQQVAAIRRLMMPAKNSKGEVLYAFPYIPGTETQWVGYNYYGKPNARLPPRIANLELPGQFLGYFVDERVREHVDALSFDFDRDPQTLARSRRIYDATSFDLRAFKTRGGKMLMWHGWADGAIMATSSIAYYQGVSQFMGGREQTQDFFRLFLIPGVHHGSGGPGLPYFDAFSALEEWVEQGRAPEKLIAGREEHDVSQRTRPVYPYPTLARYSGRGDPRRAESFVPFQPAR